MIPKLSTKARIEEKSKKSRNLMTIFVAVILLASIAGFAFEFNTSEQTKYKEFKFSQAANGLWQTSVNGKSIQTSLLPQDVENITISGSIDLNDFSGKIYYIAKSWNMQAMQELGNTLNAKQFQPACLPEQENETDCSDLPLKSCSDASFNQPIIIFKEANETSAEYSNYCLVLNTDLNDSSSSAKAADAAIFKINGILS